jgi:excinuclease UvrABC ATPase subunit
LTFNNKQHLLKLRGELERTRQKLVRARKSLQAVAQELDLLRQWSELASSRSDLPEEAENVLKLDSDQIRDKDLVWFRVNAAMEERERLAKELNSVIVILESSLKAISTCPECKGTGKVIVKSSYERLEEGRIIQTNEEADCELCTGSGVLKINDW